MTEVQITIVYHQEERIDELEEAILQAAIRDQLGDDVEVTIEQWTEDQ